MVTFDHEHVPGEHIRALVADGRHRLPGRRRAAATPRTSAPCGERLGELGAPVPRWRPVGVARRRRRRSRRDRLAGDRQGDRGGYDGRGVWPLDGPGRRRPLLDRGIELIVEERVPLRRELAAWWPARRAGRSPPTRWCETVQRDGICVEVLAPAPGLAEARRGRRPRSWPSGSPPSSTSSACSPSSCSNADGGGSSSTSWPCGRTTPATGPSRAPAPRQFEQHLRAVLDYPLGDTSLTAPAVVDGQRARRTRPAACASTSGCTTSSPPTRASRCTSTASRSGPAARSAT